MQRQRADREVKAVVAERDQLRIGGDPRASGSGRKGWGRLSRDDELEPRASAEGARQRPDMRPEIEDVAKAPIDIVEALDQAPGDLGMQKIDATPPGGALAMASPCAAIKQHRRIAFSSRHRALLSAAG